MMILSEGFDAVVEALYCEAELTPYLSKSDVIVNPTNNNYYGKIIIISMPIDNKIIQGLIGSNKIISRIPLEFPEGSFIYEPYDLSKKLNLKPLEDSNIIADKEYFKQIKYLVINSHIYAEVPESILDKEYKGDKTFLGLINLYLNHEAS